MTRLFTIAAFAISMLALLAACGGESSEGEPATPVREDAPVVKTNDINAMLLPSDVTALAGGGGITAAYIERKSQAAAIDPAQVEHMDSFESLVFTGEDHSRSLTLTAIKFDSDDAAADRSRLMSEGMKNMSAKIGDGSAYVDLNDSGIGSMVVLKKGVWVVSLHTAQPDGVTPLVNLSGVEALARTVADRL